MQITITATDQITTIGAIQVRVWEGVTERGVKCKVMVHRLAVHDAEDASQFEQELVEKLPPVRFVPLSMIL